MIMMILGETFPTLDRLGLFNKRLRSAWNAKISKVDIHLGPKRRAVGRIYSFQLENERGTGMLYPPLGFMDLKFLEKRILEELRDIDFLEFTAFFLEKRFLLAAPMIQDPWNHPNPYGTNPEELKEYKSRYYQALKDFYERYYSYLNTPEMIKNLKTESYTQLVEVCIQSMNVAEDRLLALW